MNQSGLVLLNPVVGDRDLIRKGRCGKDLSNERIRVERNRSHESLELAG